MDCARTRSLSRDKPVLLFAAEFDDCEVIVGPAITTLRAEVPDQPALWGIAQRIIGLGLEVTNVNRVAHHLRQQEERGQRVINPGIAGRPTQTSHDVEDNSDGLWI